MQPSTLKCACCKLLHKIVSDGNCVVLCGWSEQEGCMTHPDGVGKHQDRLHVAKRQLDLSTKYTNKSFQYNVVCCIDWHDQLEWLWHVLVLFNPVLTPMTANCIGVSSGMMTAWKSVVLASAAV
jgi:hypothetical protein